MSGIDATRAGSIGNSSFLGKVESSLPFDPKSTRLPEKLPFCEKTERTNRLPAQFLGESVLPKRSS